MMIATPSSAAPQRAPLVALVLLAGWLMTSTAYGEEAERPASSLASISRDLLSGDATARQRAAKRLLAATPDDGELRAYFTKLGKATAAWASHRERLLDDWVQQAVHGTAKGRAEAARLLSALGPVAIERLTRELRRAAPQESKTNGSAAGSTPRARKPTARVAPAAPVESPATTPPTPEDRGAEAKGAEEKGAEAKRANTAHIYDVRDLRKRGMNAVEVRSLLQKAPDASEVKNVGGGVYVVTASKEGHLALRIRLEELRTSIQTLLNPRERTYPQAGTVRAWTVVPTIYRVPRSVIAQPSGRYGAAVKRAGLPEGLDPLRSEVRTGTAVDAGMWMRLLQQGPGGVQGTRADGTTAHGHLVFFAGRERSYRKSIAQAADGRFVVELGSIRAGLELDVALTPNGKHLDILLLATRVEVAEPIPAIVVPHGPTAGPNVIDRPEWSRTRTRIPFRLPLTGGGAFVSLGGLGSNEQEHFIVVLQVVQRKKPGK